LPQSRQPPLRHGDHPWVDTVGATPPRLTRR